MWAGVKQGRGEKGWGRGRGEFVASFIGPLCLLSTISLSPTPRPPIWFVPLHPPRSLAVIAVVHQRDRIRRPRGWPVGGGRGGGSGGAVLVTGVFVTMVTVVASRNRVNPLSCPTEHSQIRFPGRERRFFPPALSLPSLIFSLSPSLSLHCLLDVFNRAG
jgi:hypothetical protein